MTPRADGAARTRDAFHWYCRMDLATTVAAARAGDLTAEQAGDILRGIQDLIAWGEQQPSHRPSDYLDVQALLIERTGPGASRMHAGRSRQDMLATLHRLILRDRVLELLPAVQRLRGALLEQARAFGTVVVPAYTNGVQAQPVLYPHLMCGYEAPLARSTDRYREGFARLNRSPLGAAALATSRFPVDRQRIAQLLGFDGCVDNAFDAAQLGVVDVGVECAQIAALIALSMNMYTQDVHAQFHHARPWISLGGPGLSGPSTLMPQKRNPVALNRVRLLGSEVLGAAMSAALTAHNVASGMTDYKRLDAARALELSVLQVSELVSVLEGIELHPDAAMEELHAGYATASELAAVLQVATDLPLGFTHAFSSRLVDAARGERQTLAEVPETTLHQLFTDTLSELGIEQPPPFPLTHEAYREAVHPAAMVRSYAGEGGSSPQEVRRMLDAAEAAIDRDQEAVSALAGSVAASEASLAAEVQLLLAG